MGVWRLCWQRQGRRSKRRGRHERWQTCCTTLARKMIRPRRLQQLHRIPRRCRPLRRGPLQRMQHLLGIQNRNMQRSSFSGWREADRRGCRRTNVGCKKCRSSSTSSQRGLQQPRRQPQRSLPALRRTSSEAVSEHHPGRARHQLQGMLPQTQSHFNSRIRAQTRTMQHQQLHLTPPRQTHRQP